MYRQLNSAVNDERARLTASVSMRLVLLQSKYDRTLGLPSFPRKACPVLDTGREPRGAGGLDVRQNYLESILGYSGVLLGLRGEESRSRKQHLSAHDGRGGRHGVPSMSPIWDWSTSDVWEYIRAHDLPICGVYDVLARLGIPARQQRVGPVALCTAHQLIDGWPDLYLAAVSRYGPHWGVPLASAVKHYPLPLRADLPSAIRKHMPRWPAA